MLKKLTFEQEDTLQDIVADMYPHLSDGYKKKLFTTYGIDSATDYTKYILWTIYEN